ncbi:hypothetical protein TNCV_3283491 [Trichonephila clavipes]|nr:hypothetical protein TNCV_3283491 [Trichonephila clavipes]
MERFRFSSTGHCGHSSLVAMVMRLWPACHELEYNATKYLPCRVRTKYTTPNEVLVERVITYHPSTPVTTSSSSRTTRGPLVKNLEILRTIVPAQVKRTTPELAFPSPNFHTTPLGGRSSLDTLSSETISSMGKPINVVELT